MSIKRAVFLFACAALIALCAWQIWQTPPLLQYVTPAPAAERADAGDADGQKKSGPTPLEQVLRRLAQTQESWEGIVSAWAVTMDAPQAQLEGERGRSAQAHLMGEYGSSRALPGRLLAAGRNFYPEELLRGDSVIILDEQLAIALFRVGDPVGRRVLLGDKGYTVVGVARHSRAAGDMEAFGACVPLLSLQGRAMETLTVWARPVAGAGALAKFKADMTGFDPKGCLYSLSQERERALLPVWLLLTVCSLVLLLMGWRAFGRAVMWLRADYMERLRHRFAMQMAPRLVLYASAGALLMAALLAASYAWAQLLLRPVKIFPEWVPAVPVEVSEIMATYWKNVSVTGRLTELRSPQVLALRMWRAVVRIPCLVAGGVLMHSFGRLRGKHKRQERNSDLQASAQ